MKREKKKMILPIVLLVIVIFTVLFCYKTMRKESPEQLLAEYMSYIEQQDYEAMYAMTDNENLDKTSFIQRNSRIYEGIEASNVVLENMETNRKGKKTQTVSYTMTLDTVAGEVRFQNETDFCHTKEGYKIVWNDNMIFPDLEASDKVKVVTTEAQRGEITDRNGKVLAGQGTAISVGIIPGKLENKEASLQKIAELLKLDVDEIVEELAAGWVTEDSFVPIATLPEVSELELMKINQDAEKLEEYERQQELLEISGVMLSETEVRTYSLGEAAAHLIGYVQSVTAEDLENHAWEGYTSNSVIGRCGMEGLYEAELKGQNGCRISIVDENGELKEILAEICKQNGTDIQLTIDAELQQALYEEFGNNPGCSVALQPYTGEVLALVSTPSYDNNDFILGISSEKWTELNESESQPLFNRFRQVWCPGSTLKPVIAAIGLELGIIDPNEDYGNEGLSWQKDSSWGSYYVTTLHAYEPVTMENAIINSDNIYFAKAALKIGSENLMSALDELGFNKELPFEIVMSKSQYSNSETIEMEIQLADTGYGQGQVLINPLHLASLYTAFLNEGTILKPYLNYENDTEIWIENAFSKETVNSVLEGMIGVVNDPEGTAYVAHRDEVILAGKTGTAELKASKEDPTGTEIGWFAVFTEEKEMEHPILIVSMVENVKEIGGSTYVVRKDSEVLDSYFR